jgi:hypothetical protein
MYNHCPYIPLCSSAAPENWYDSYEVRRWSPLSVAKIVDSGSTSPTSTNGSDSASTNTGSASKTADSDANII